MARSATRRPHSKPYADGRRRRRVPPGHVADLPPSGVARQAFMASFQHGSGANPTSARAPLVHDELDVEDFVRSAHGLYLLDEPYPAVIETLAELLAGDYQEGFLEWGIGAGKTYLASLFLLMQAARVLSSMIIGDFWERVGIAEGTTVELSCFAPSQASASDVLHNELVAKARRAPWFAERAPIDAKIRSRIRFIDPRSGEHFPLRIVPYGCSLTNPLGRNIYAAVIDEAGFWPVSNSPGGDVVAEIYNLVTRRIRSRFGTRGQMLMISSSAYEGDLASRKQAEAQEVGTGVFYERKATWEVKPRDRWTSDRTFDFTEEDDAGSPVRVWRGIPLDLKKDFDRDPLLALRDYAGRRLEADMGFDPQAMLRFEEPPPPEGRGPYPDRRQPFVRSAPYTPLPDFLPVPGARYFLHFDLATSGSVNADALGMALCHAEWREDERLYSHHAESHAFADDPYENAVVVMDFAWDIRPRDVGGERCIEDTRELVYELLRRGFRLARVTYDGFQSTDSIQILRRRGVPAGLISVDRSTEPYQLLRRLLVNGRVEYGPSLWLAEYARLRMARGAKIDHHPRGSKDVADAVASVALQCYSDVMYRHGIFSDGEQEAAAERMERHALRASSAQDERLARLAERTRRRRHGSRNDGG